MFGKILTAVFALVFSVATVFMSTGVAEAKNIVADGMVLYWSFDADDVKGDIVSDVVGGNDGTLVGGPETGEGKYGDGLMFDGTDDYVEVPEIALGDFTIEAWFQATSAPGEWCRIFDGGLGAPGDVFISPAYGRTGGDIGIGMHANSPVVGEIGTGVKAVVDQWYHVAATYDKDGDGMKFYLDGELKGEFAYNAESFEDWAFPQNWYLGKANWGDPLFPGIIDEFRIYDRALNADEVEQNMNAESLVVVSSDEKLAGTWGEIKKK